MPWIRSVHCLVTLAVLLTACSTAAPPAPTAVPTAASEPPPTSVPAMVPSTATSEPATPTVIAEPEPTPTAIPEPTPIPETAATVPPLSITAPVMPAAPIGAPEPIVVVPPAGEHAADGSQADSGDSTSTGDRAADGGGDIDAATAEGAPPSSLPPTSSTVAAAPAPTVRAKPTARPAAKPTAKPAPPVLPEPTLAPTRAPEPTPAPRVGYLERVPSPTYAVHVFLWGNPETTQRDLRLAGEAGFTHVKQRFEWRNIERDGKGRFEWDEPDRIVRAVSGAGLKIIARVDNQPKWAREDALFPGTGPASNPDDWRDFVAQLAARYKGKIQAYEIWNEPNIDREWGGSTPNAAEYTALLRVGYQAIKRADADAIVVSAGLSPTTNDGSQARPDGVFLQQMYRAGAKDAFDMLGVHAAGFKAEPEADPGEVAASPQLTNGDPSPAELKRTYAFRHVEDIRRIMVENGDRDKRIAIMEMGWTSDVRPGSPYRWHGVGEEQKGQNVVRAFKLAREQWRPWIAYMSLIYLAQPDWTEKDEQYWWSVTNPNGTPRPSYNAIKAALR